MKKIFTISLIFSFAVAALFFSCKKNKPCEGCGDGNKAPVAIAGPDQVITLPTDSILLDGSSSNDPDGTISEWLWRKIEEPGSSNINNSTSAKAVVKNIVAGLYKFELKVKDNDGLSAKDTVQVVVTTQANLPPFAVAGVDQVITLPVNAVTVDGSGSTDPNNNISGYSWTKISGPSSFVFLNANAVQTQINNLAQGVYQFELKVTDLGGLFSRDTMRVIVNPIQNPLCPPTSRPIIDAQLIQVGNLSVARAGIATVSSGNKIFFAGGYNASGVSSRVDIYDVVFQTWATAELSIPRTDISVISSGDKVFFAGGSMINNIRSSRIDIYNTTTQTWSTAELSQARSASATAAVGNKVFFAGGYTDNSITGRIDIYDASVNSWSTAGLSETRIAFTATTAGNKIYFAGGWNGIDGSVTSDKIDIYDNATNSWTISAMSTPKAYFASFYKNGKIYWAGGADYVDWANDIRFKCEVEIRDVNTQLSTFTNLSQPNWIFNAYEKDNKIVFPIVSWWLPLASFDVYDMTTDSWSIAVLNVSMPPIGGAIISKSNIIYFAGGGWYNGGAGRIYTDKVWKLVF